MMQTNTSSRDYLAVERERVRRDNNPRTPNVRGVGRREIKSLFPTLQGSIKSITLALPIARLTARKGFALTNFLESIPFLRTQLLAVLDKH